MKITIEHLGNKAVVDDETAHDICDAIELFEASLLKIGFDPPRIKAAFHWKSAEIKEKPGHIDF